MCFHCSEETSQTTGRASNGSWPGPDLEEAAGMIATAVASRLPLEGKLVGKLGPASVRDLPGDRRISSRPSVCQKYGIDGYAGRITCASSCASSAADDDRAWSGDSYRTLPFRACKFRLEDSRPTCKGELGHLIHLPPTCQRICSRRLIMSSTSPIPLYLDAAIDFFDLPTSLLHERQIPISRTTQVGGMPDRCPIPIFRQIYSLIPRNPTLRLSYVDSKSMART